jgi:cob(I)alamin adenosyltransferase
MISEIKTFIFNKMMKKSSVYTRTGDKGNTSLYCGRRAPKSDIVFDVLGSCDELSSRIGLLCAFTINNMDSKNIIPVFRKIQQNIQDINSILATCDIRKQEKLRKITEEDIKNIEQDIDRIDSQNPRLTSFILPGTNTMDAQAHLCRTQTRTVERMLWKLYEKVEDPVESVYQSTEILIEDFELILKYVNRLSDFFFVMARFLSL